MVARKHAAATASTYPKGKAPASAPVRLPRGPHTAQLTFHLAVHGTLILLSSLILPAHLLSRKKAATSDLGLLSSVSLFFSLPHTPDNVAILRKTMWGVVQAVGLVQAWALIRFKKWFDLGVAIEQGDVKAAEEVTKRGWVKGAELLSLTSVSLPVALLLFHALVIVLGAPFLSDTKSTLCLSLALSMIIAFPLLHIAPSLSSLPLFASPWPRTKHLYHLLWTMLLVPLLAALVGAAPLTFDHGKAWLAWPVPPLMGMLMGVVISDVVGGVRYLIASDRKE